MKKSLYIAVIGCGRLGSILASDLSLQGHEVVVIDLTGSGIIAAYGYSLSESLFEYASALSTVGLSVGVTAANAPAGLLWTEIAGMFLGRLELFPVFIGLIRLYRDIQTLAE